MRLLNGQTRVETGAKQPAVSARLRITLPKLLLRRP